MGWPGVLAGAGWFLPDGVVAAGLQGVVETICGNYG